MTQITMRSAGLMVVAWRFFAAGGVIETWGRCVPQGEQWRFTMPSNRREMALAATLQVIADKILSDETASGDRINHAERLQKLAARMLVAAAKAPAPRAALSLS